MTVAPQVTVVVPFFNEAPNVGPLVAELRVVLGDLGITPEIILVDDGSTDSTWAELEKVATGWPAVRLLRFAHNRGQAAALWAAFHAANGDWIATLDGDGQNPPSELARLWAERETADMLAGCRAGRKDSLLRRLMSRTANGVRRIILRDGVTDTGCALKLFRREMTADFLPIRTLYSFLPAFATSAGWRVREIPVAHRPRVAGDSKYGLKVMAVLPLLDTLALWWILRRRLRSRPAGGNTAKS
jgi:dolichol-phosphate mannosyltransferase